MLRLIGLIKKEFIHFYRDPISMALILYHFTLCIVLCGYCFIFEASNIPMTVYDMDKTTFSRELIHKFVSTEYFNLHSFATSYDDVREAIDSGSAKAALIVPSDFSRKLKGEKSVSIQFVCDATDANQAGQGLGYAKMIIGDYNKNIVLTRLNKKGILLSQLPGISNSVRTFYSQELDSIYFVVILHIVVAGLIGGLILSSTAIVREKERGTIDQLLVTPANTFEIILAKTIAPITIGLIATVFSFIVCVWFGVPCYGNALTFFVFMFFFLVGNVGQGILIGCICDNMLQAILLSFAAWFPGIAMSGMLLPIENMVPFCQALSQVFPATHFMIAANGIFQKDIGFATLWPQAVILMMSGGVLFLIGYFIAWRQWKQ